MNKIEFGDCRETMRKWKEQGIKAQTCVTSPPYYGLRDYGTAKWEGGDVDCDHVESENKHGGQRADRNQEGYKKQYKEFCKKCNATRIDSQLGLEETPEEYINAMVEVFRCVWDVLEDDGTLWLNIGDSYYNYRPGQGQRQGKQSISSQKFSEVEICHNKSVKFDGQLLRLTDEPQTVLLEGCGLICNNVNDIFDSSTLQNIVLIIQLRME
jgi:DNA modification methylase